MHRTMRQRMKFNFGVALIVSIIGRVIIAIAVPLALPRERVLFLDTQTVIFIFLIVWAVIPPILRHYERHEFVKRI